MTERLRDALLVLRALDTSSTLSPLAKAAARGGALTEGLQALAAEYGKEADVSGINARGEFSFSVIGPEGRGPGRPSGQYGEELAAWLSTVPRRTGVAMTSAAVMPENGWCWVNHFDAERLLNAVADQVLGQEASAPPPGRQPG